MKKDYNYHGIEEAEAYAREKSEELYQKFNGINKSNWKEYVKEKDGQ